MHKLDFEATVASIVLDHPECARVFESHGIDFCCCGKVSVLEVCARQDLDPERVFAALSQAIEERRGEAAERDFRAMSTASLIGYLIDRHHGWLRGAMPSISRMMTQVARVHGEHQPSLLTLDAEVQQFLKALAAHLDEEEATLFPAMLAAVAPGGEPLATMCDDHERVGAALRSIRALAQDFALPEWACTTYRALFAELAAMEADLHLHVHLENNVLAPRFSV